MKKRLLSALCCLPAFAMASEPTTGTLIEISGLGILLGLLLTGSIFHSWVRPLIKKITRK